MKYVHDEPYSFDLLQLQQLPGTSSSAATGQDIALARQFFEASHGGPAFAPSAIPELSSPQINEAWVAEQQQHMRMFESSKVQSQWAAEFDGSAMMSRQTPLAPQLLHSDRKLYSCLVITLFIFAHSATTAVLHATRRNVWQLYASHEHVHGWTIFDAKLCRTNRRSRKREG